MLRLAHRILSGKPHLSYSLDKDYMPAALAEQRLIAKSPIFIVDDVALFYERHEQEVWGIEEFPHVKPPVPCCFIEFNVPLVWCGEQMKQPGCHLQQVGVFSVESAVADWRKMYFLTQKKNIPDPFDVNAKLIGMLESHGECESMVSQSLWLGMSGIAHFCFFKVFLLLNKQGAILDYCTLSPPLKDGTSSQGFSNIVIGNDYNPIWLAISFMHCKNTATIDATEDQGPSRKWLRRKKQPTLKYYTLDIEPMKKVLRKEGDSEETGLKKALHICRGHFATYTEDKPLFGKHTGTYWVPAHTRGSLSEGVVKKDYRVKL